MARSMSVFENSRALSWVIWTIIMSPGSLQTACAIQPTISPNVFPVRAGPTKTTASWRLDERTSIGSTMYGVSEASQ